MVEVAVIGAGAAGLVAARHVLRLGLRASIFDSRLFTGGAWSAPSHVPTSSTARLSPQMWDNLTPNLSKFTCCFSDMMWPEETPTFPTLENMKNYLDDYASRYILNNDNCSTHFGCTVTLVDRRRDSNSSSSTSTSHKAQYSVTWDNSSGESNTKIFDGVVVATGFFSTPQMPDPVHSWWQQDTEDVSTRRVLHSSQYRSPSNFVNQTVAVIGCSFSAHEIAADLRRHATPRVINLVGDQPHRIPYIVPHYVPVTGDTGGFVPIDCAMYQRTDNVPKDSEAVSMDTAACQARHERLRQWIGARKLQQAASVGLSMSHQSLTSPPLVSISEDYLNLAIDRKIEIVPGRLQQVSLTPIQNDRSIQQDDSKLDLELTDGSIVQQVDRIIACTGYKPCLDFLAPEIRNELQYDEHDSFAPLLACYDAVHPNLPGFGLVGMYKGPYFGVMELQARLIAGLISGQGKALSNETAERALAASRSIREGRPRAQFPRFDYVGTMDTLATELGLVPEGDLRSAGMMVSPYFYQPDTVLADQGKRALDKSLQQCNNICRTAFNALVGLWTFERSIHCQLTASTQRVHGTISYSLSGPDLECLRYREDGFLELPNGNQLEVFREYEYLIQSDMMNIHFVEQGELAHLFLSLRFSEGENMSWTATSDHLCINDLYKGTFKITFDGLSATEVVMKYNVKGPNKDYESVTNLRPLL